MNALFFVMLVIGALICIYFMLVLVVGVLGMILASKDWYFTSPEQGKTTIIMRGKVLKTLWPNVGSHRISSEQDLNGFRWIVKDDGPGNWWRWFKSFFHSALPGTKFFQYLLWRFFGVRFISPFWPWVKVHTFKVSRMHLKESSTDDPKKPLSSRIVPSLKNDEPVNALLQLAPRPISKKVELAGDNADVEILFLARFQAVIPTLAAVYLEGDYYPLLDAAVQASMVDFAANHRVAVWKKRGRLKGHFALPSYKLPKKKGGESASSFETRIREYEANYEPVPLTLSHWLKIGTGAGSLIENHVGKINVSYDYCQRLKEEGRKELLDHLQQLQVVPAEEEGIISGLAGIKRELSDGIIPGLGFALISLEVVDRDAFGDLATAYRQKEIKKREADGVREEARGQSDADKLIAEGRAALYGRPVKALKDLGVTPDVAARILETDQRTANIGGGESSVVTYIEGGASSSVMVPAQGKPVTPPPPSSAPVTSSSDE